MQTVSSLFNEIWESDGARTESRLFINGEEYGPDEIISLRTNLSAFGDVGNFAIGKAPARELTAMVRRRVGEIPEMAEVRPQIRVTDGSRVSEWIPKGVFYIDTKTVDFQRNYLEISAFDKLLMAEQSYGDTALSFPATDVTVLLEIAGKLDMDIDARTWDVMRMGYAVEDPTEGTLREALGVIAAAYCGCFITSDAGKLLLISLYDAPSSRVLGTAETTALSVGGVLIGV